MRHTSRGGIEDKGPLGRTLVTKVLLMVNRDKRDLASKRVLYLESHDFVLSGLNRILVLTDTFLCELSTLRPRYLWGYTPSTSIPALPSTRISGMVPPRYVTHLKNGHHLSLLNGYPPLLFRPGTQSVNSLHFFCLVISLVKVSKETTLSHHRDYDSH